MSQDLVRVAVKTSIVGACMARGLTAEETQEVYSKMAHLEVAETIEEIYLQIEGEINAVRDARLDERWPDRR